MKKKSVRMRLGVAVMLSENELSVIKSGGSAAKGMVQDLFNIGKFSLDGDTCVPSCPESENEWPVEEDLEFVF